MFEPLLDTIIEKDSGNPDINPEIPENPERLFLLSEKKQFWIYW